MGTVALVVLEIFEKTGAYANSMFSKKKLFLAEMDKNETQIANKLSVAMETPSRAICLAPISFFLFFTNMKLNDFATI